MIEHISVMKSLTEKHGNIIELIAGRAIQYIDIPMYLNIGDHLIAHGTFYFFEKNGIRVKRAAGIEWFRPSWIEDSEVLVFGGGGNFGDLYPRHHEARMVLVKEALVRGRTVIVLPQSLWYEEEQNRIKDEMLLKEQPNFHLFTRDKQSFDIAKTVSKNVYLAPDMAHHLYDDLNSFRNEIVPTEDVLYFLRKDKEAVPTRAISSVSCDWDDVVILNDCCRKLNKTMNLYKKLWRYEISFIDKRLDFWRKNSWRIVSTAARLFLNHETIVTDRLHGMIFAALLNRNVQVMDNSYSKVSNYKKEWFDLDPIIK